jgi:type IV pilus assembly protein PilF
VSACLAVACPPRVFATLAANVLLAACSTAAPGPSANVSARAHTELAAAYYQSAQYATAAAEARAALASDPAYAPAHNLHGLVLMATGQLDAAQAALDRAVGLDPQDADARNNRAVLLCRIGRVDEALRDWEAAARTPYYATPEQSSRNAAACLAAHRSDLTASGRAANVTGPRSDTAERDAP